MRIPWTRLRGPGLACLGPLLLYAASLAPDLETIDSGELACACVRLGIAHPTGYPLYTLLGRIAGLALPASTAIARLNFLSAILAAASCLFVFLLFREISNRVRPAADPRGKEILALGGAWLWAAHPALWTVATGNEVHALQAALIAALLWQASRAGAGSDTRPAILSAYLLGLALTNHMTALYLVPGLVAGAIATEAGRAALRRPRALALIAAAFLLPLSLYLYLPLRGRAGPIPDWGDPTSAAGFLRHVGGAQYRVWLFASWEGWIDNARIFLGEITRARSAPLLLGAAAGGIALASRDRAGLLRFGSGFLVGGAWASGYEIHDLEPYYLVPRICLAATAAAGAALLLRAASTPDRPLSRPRKWLPAVTALPLIASLVLAGARFPEMSRRGDHYVRLYAQSLLDRLPPRAILFSRHWDMVVSPLLYLQQVEGRRPDVTVVDTELLRRSWYFRDLRRRDPSLLTPIEEKVALFLEQLRLFETRAPYDPAVIEDRYRAVIAGIFEAHRDLRPVFHTPDVEGTFYGDWSGIPEALAIRMVPRPAAAPDAEPLDPDAWSAQAAFADDPVRVNAWDFARRLARGRILFLQDYGRTAEAERWRQAAGRFDAIPLTRIREDPWR